MDGTCHGIWEPPTAAHRILLFFGSWYLYVRPDGTCGAMSDVSTSRSFQFLRVGARGHVMCRPVMGNTPRLRVGKPVPRSHEIDHACASSSRCSSDLMKKLLKLGIAHLQGRSGPTRLGRPAGVMLPLKSITLFTSPLEEELFAIMTGLKMYHRNCSYDIANCTNLLMCQGFEVSALVTDQSSSEGC
jgi:hypothetical protein